MDSRCIEQSLRSEDPPALADYSWCGCCVADCPDVHAEPDSEFLAIPGAVLAAEEYVATLDKLRQRDLREQEERGELRIVPRAELQKWADKLRG
jgi:succinate dehydrogenase/fumarate reductase-like Fe-S protein